MTVRTATEEATRAKRRARPGAGPTGAADGQLGFDLAPPRAAAPVVPSRAIEDLAAPAVPSRAVERAASASGAAPVARAVASPSPATAPASRTPLDLAPPRGRTAGGPVGASTPVPPAVLAPPVPIAATPALRARGRSSSRGTSLDALLTGTWQGLLAHGSVRCPVCRGAMTPRYAAGPKPVGGRCRDCGSSIA